MTTNDHDHLAAAYDLACDALVARALDIAARLVGRDRIHRLPSGALAVMFGSTEERLMLAGPGLVELRIETQRPAQSVEALVRGEVPAPQLRCSPRAYSLGSDATLDSCEAQGAALVDAARFGRALLALLAA